MERPFGAVNQRGVSLLVRPAMRRNAKRPHQPHRRWGRFECSVMVPLCGQVELDFLRLGFLRVVHGELVVSGHRVREELLHVGE